MSELSRRERKKLETKEKIYHCAIELFLSCGFETTSIEQITQKADVGKGTFYNYFPTKEAVTLEYFRRYYEQMIEKRRSSVSSSVREKLALLLTDWASLMMDNREIAWQAVKSREGAELDRALHYAIMAIITLGQREGDISSHFDAGFLAESLEGMMLQHFVKWHVGGGNLLAEVNNIVSVFLDGLTDFPGALRG